MSPLSKFYTPRPTGGTADIAHPDLRGRLIESVAADKAPKGVIEFQNTRSVRVEAKPAAVEAPAPAPAERIAAPEAPAATDGRADLDSAFTMLSRATSCFELLTQKLDQVEAERNEAVAQIEESQQVASQWRAMIDGLEGRLGEAERDMARLGDEIRLQTARAEAAEERAAAAEAMLKAAERRAASLDASCLQLYDQIMSSFGTESIAHRALEILTQQNKSKAA